MRNSFLPLIPELEYAADLLQEAVAALRVGDEQTARERLRAADMPEICAYFGRIAGPTDPEVHWQEKSPKDVLPKHARATLRMPSVREERAVFERDGWRCRYCGTRIIYKKARQYLTKVFPAEARWGTRNAEKHCALAALTASLDHIVPHSRGGTNEPENLVAACGPCQFGRSDWTLEEVGFFDPRERPPVVDDWDGLLSVLEKRPAEA